MELKKSLSIWRLSNVSALCNGLGALHCKLKQTLS
jgi:hypothetical protein